MLKKVVPVALLMWMVSGVSYARTIYPTEIDAYLDQVLDAQESWRVQSDPRLLRQSEIVVDTLISGIDLTHFPRFSIDDIASVTQGRFLELIAQPAREQVREDLFHTMRDRRHEAQMQARLEQSRANQQAACYAPNLWDRARSQANQVLSSVLAPPLVYPDLSRYPVLSAQSTPTLQRSKSAAATLRSSPAHFVAPHVVAPQQPETLEFREDYSYNHATGTLRFAEVQVPPDGMCARHALGISNRDMIARLLQTLRTGTPEAKERLKDMITDAAHRRLGVSSLRSLSDEEYETYINRYLRGDYLDHDVTQMVESGGSAHILRSPIKPTGTLGAALMVYGLNARVWQMDANNEQSLVLSSIYVNNPRGPFIDLVHKVKINPRAAHPDEIVQSYGSHYNLLVDLDKPEQMQTAIRMSQNHWINPALVPLLPVRPQQGR